jgi:hypothetical protein
MYHEMELCATSGTICCFPNMILPVTYIKIKHQNCRNQKAHTVSAAEVGGINNVRPPSMQSLLRKKVAGLGAKYLK